MKHETSLSRHPLAWRNSAKRANRCWNRQIRSHHQLAQTWTGRAFYRVDRRNIQSYLITLQLTTCQVEHYNVSSWTLQRVELNITTCRIKHHNVSSWTSQRVESTIMFEHVAKLFFSSVNRTSDSSSDTTFFYISCRWAFFFVILYALCKDTHTLLYIYALRFCFFRATADKRHCSMSRVTRCNYIMLRTWQL